MNTFIDPRTSPQPQVRLAPGRPTEDPGTLADLHRLCRDGRLYDVERWIGRAAPLQLAPGTSVASRRGSSALEIALDRRDHALVFLLLCNGYDPNLETESPLDLALRGRRWDLVDLLLEWGADPKRVDPDALFGTYQSRLFERFRALGFDFCDGHALAEALAYHTSNKPLFGFAKRHRDQDAGIQVELNVALAHHAGEGNEKGVSLCLWAGADPHAPACNLRYCYCGQARDGELEDEDEPRGWSAVFEACKNGQVEILERLRPAPGKDDFDELFRWTRSGGVVEILTRQRLPRAVGSVIQSQLWWLSFDNGWRSVDTLRCLFEAGMRWEHGSKSQVGEIRRDLLRTSDSAFVDLMKLFATTDFLSEAVRAELGRTPAMRRRMKEVGFIPSEPDDPKRFERLRPTRSREVVAKFGVATPRAKKARCRLRRTEYIGGQHPGHRELRMDRSELFDRVWAEPIVTLAERWGLSGRGLAKACDRLQIPVPPRGFWAKLRAGKRVTRPRLPALPEGEAEEIVVWAPDDGS